MKKESLFIILKLYKEGNIDEAEAVQLISDLIENNTVTWYPYYTTPQITWGNGDITCKCNSYDAK